VKTKAVHFEKQGDPSVLKMIEADLPDPGEGEAQIRQSAIGINFMDVYQRGGQYDVALPFRPGLEGAGVVEKLGAGVDGLAVGDRVAYAGVPGGYAEARNIPAARLVKIPDGVSDEQAAAAIMKGMTVEYLMERAYPVKAGEWVLFYAAAGGVGLIAGQWGKLLGARMIGIAGGADKCQLALDNGYEAALDRRTENIVERVKELTGGAGVAVAYDSIGKETYEQTLDCLAPRGFFMSFGTTSGPVPPVYAKELQNRGSLYFSRPTLATYTAARAGLEHSASRVFDMIASGKVKIEIGQTYALDDVVQAHLDLEAGKTKGSSLLIP